ncbi:cytidylate kinase-like family protein [Pectinatus frisingensis]|uniref:cytidylate kinase-like family protein n=1 Tax=Pectinatus frisingensis TaxID=865 RepID=UPI0018C62F13|nr:cytidylate kinase-like family protein [Pectinatus frisingensis]
MIITIGRQYGAGGREIAEKLAKTLKTPLYDRKLVAFISAHLDKGISLDELDLTYENLYGDVSPYETMFNNLNIKDGNYLFSSQSKAIKALAGKGSGIFIGRCTNYILKDSKSAYHFYITADDDFRTSRGISVYNKTLKELKAEDDKRSSYYNYYTGTKWGDPVNYDITINVGRVGVDGALKIITNYVK